MLQLIAAALSGGSVGGGGGGGGGGGDPSYDLIVADWDDIAASPYWGTNAAETITFTQTSPRVLMFSFPDMVYGTLSYSLNGGSRVPIVSGATLAVVTTNTLSFRYANADSPETVTVTVYDTTNASAVVDTFVCSGTGGP
jgi:hypothetical protein